MKLSERLSAQAEAEATARPKPVKAAAAKASPRPSVPAKEPTLPSRPVRRTPTPPPAAASPSVPTGRVREGGLASRTAGSAPASRNSPAAGPSPSSRATKTIPTPRRRKSDFVDPAEGLEGLDALRVRVRAAAVAILGPTLSADAVDERRVRQELEAQLDEALRHSSFSISPSERSTFIDATMADMLGWGALTALMADPEITEVMCNRHDLIFIERGGRIEQTTVRFPTMQSYRQVIDRMLATAGRRIDESQPMADGRLPDGSRINAVIPPLAVHGPVLTIRRFPEKSFTVTDLIAKESLSADASVFLEAAVRGKLNIIVSGGTGTGKTTLLNVLASFIPPDERLITIEDAAELRLGQPHVVTLEGRPANIEGAGHVSIRDLVRNALRMRPDRIVVGEVRDAAALDMLQAMNTGHEGSLTTIHANSPRDALSRIETMVLFSGIDLPLRAIREQVASALDLVVQLERRTDGSRVVSAITEVQGREGDTITLQDIYSRKSGGSLAATGLRPSVADKIAERGVTLAATHFRNKARTVAATGAGLSRRAR